MTETLGMPLGGNMRKKAVMELAESIAGSKKIKIDRAGKRTKEELICWFRENAAELLAEEIPHLEKKAQKSEAKTSNQILIEDYQVQKVFREEEEESEEPLVNEDIPEKVLAIQKQYFFNSEVRQSRRQIPTRY
jgi:asparagine synthetase B (glutamine-hydrolysing)